MVSLIHYVIASALELFFTPMYIDGHYKEISKYKIVEIDILIMCKFAEKAGEWKVVYVYIILSTHSLQGKLVSFCSVNFIESQQQQ